MKINLHMMGWDHFLHFLHHHFLYFPRHHFLQFLPQIPRLLTSALTFFQSYDMTTSDPQRKFWFVQGLEWCFAKYPILESRTLSKKKKKEINLDSVGEYGLVLSIASRKSSWNLGLRRLPRILEHSFPARLNWANSAGSYHADKKIKTVLFNRRCGFCVFVRPAILASFSFCGLMEIYHRISPIRGLRIAVEVVSVKKF